jgi:hypothetical protein
MYAKVVVDSAVVAPNGPSIALNKDMELVEGANLGSTCFADIEAPNGPSKGFEAGKLGSS